MRVDVDLLDRGVVHVRLERAGAGELGDDASTHRAITDRVERTLAARIRTWLIVASSSLSHAPTSSCWRRASAARDERGAVVAVCSRADSSSSIASTSRLATRSISGATRSAVSSDQPAIGDGHRSTLQRSIAASSVRRFDTKAASGRGTAQQREPEESALRHAAAAGEHGRRERIVGELEHGGRRRLHRRRRSRAISSAIERRASDHRERGLDRTRRELLEALREPFEPNSRGACRLLRLAVDDDRERRLGDDRRDAAEPDAAESGARCRRARPARRVMRASERSTSVASATAREASTARTGAGITRRPDGVRRLSRSITDHSPAVARVTTADSDGATGMSSHDGE